VRHATATAASTAAAVARAAAATAAAAIWWVHVKAEVATIKGLYGVNPIKVTII